MNITAYASEFLLQTIGIIGFTLYVLNYVLLTFGFLQAKHRLYFVLNLAAASFVLIGLMGAFNLASALIQMFWIVISVTGILLRQPSGQTPVFRSARNRPFYPLERRDDRLDRGYAISIRRMRAQETVARIGNPKEELRAA